MKLCCANCLKVVEDGGTNYTCPFCGCAPVPSYSYPPTSPFHPTNCRCALQETKVVRKRKLPLPTKLILK